MKKLFVLSIASGYGGAERNVELLLRYLPSNIQVRVFAEHPYHLRRLREDGALPDNASLVKVPGVKTNAKRRITALRVLRDYLKYLPDALLLNTESSAIAAAMASRFCPSIGERSHLFVHDFMWRDLDFMFERLKGAKVIVPNEAVIERLGYLAPYHVQPSGPTPYTVIPNMVEMNPGTLSYEGPFLHLATLNPWKGHVDLTIAMQCLRFNEPAITVRSYGAITDTALHQRLLALIDRFGIKDNHVISDEVDDPSPLLNACRAVVVPSRTHAGGPETFGRTVAEAWAHRKPVIAYDAGAPANLIENEVDGLLVPEGDTQAMANALKRLASSTDLCRRLGNAGYEKASRLFTPQVVIPQLMHQLNLKNI